MQSKEEEQRIHKLLDQAEKEIEELTKEQERMRQQVISLNRSIEKEIEKNTFKKPNKIYYIFPVIFIILASILLILNIYSL